MQTALTDLIKATPEGQEADRILRNCVHCGFCLATCPTYNLLGDELDSPRGRIYLMKQVLEGQQVSAKTQTHLDRCLTCCNCETTCPSGVRYGHLVDIGRKIVEDRVERPWQEKALRWCLRKFLPRTALFTPALKMGQMVRPLLPKSIRDKVPPKQNPGPWPTQQHARKILILEGCVQPAMKPATNATTARVLDRLNITAIRATGETCCGALSHHLNAQDEAKAQLRLNIDAWWPHVENGIEAIISTASGCGVMVKDYAYILKDDPQYADKAQTITELTQDLGEYLAKQDLTPLNLNSSGQRKVAFHPPCTLQHGQKLPGIVENILRKAGFELTPIPDAHLCCGSAGTYSILQKNLSQKLLKNKIQALQSGQPELIATANIGCQMHIESAAELPVHHWIELLDGVR